ncbi:P-loop containing nucleoside triphosphate hydrolase protein [Globomyces pollinis-pini]|nr:P-loop containing nucleoside triphosphate hydrolase protein [Globomyces pollinis-pini]
MQRYCFLRLYSVVLRPYQKACIDATLNAFTEDHQRVAVSMPVGSGKTVILSHLIPKIPTPFPMATKTLVLAHRQELLFQAYKTVERTLPHLRLGIDQGRKLAEYDCDVIFGSVATLGKRSGERISRFDPMHFKCIIIDVAHHATAESYQNILKYFGLFEPNNHIKLWGCSATLRRHDGIGLEPTFQKIAYAHSVSDMLKENWLCDVKVNSVKTKIQIDNIPLNNSKDYNLTALSKLVNTETRNRVVVDTYLNCVNTHKRKSALVFAVNIDHINSLVEEFKASDINAVGLSSKTTLQDRESILKKFKANEIPVLINCGILTEGTDIPCIDFILMARPTKSGVLLHQMLGRGMRTYPGKDYCLVADFVDSITGASRAATVPTLLGLNSDFVMNNSSLSSTIDAANQFENAGGTLDLITDMEDFARDPEKLRIKIKPMANPFDVSEINCDREKLKDLTGNAWVKISDDKYVLSHGQKNFIIELDCDGQFKGFETGLYTFKGKYFKQKSHNYVTSDTFAHALRGMDHYISNHLTRFGGNMLLAGAPWRTKPATEKQKALLIKYEILPTKKISAGIAADLITRFFHGAKRISEKQQLEHKRLNKKLDKAKQQFKKEIL